MNKWYCAQTYPRIEHIVHGELVRQRFNCLYLTMPVKRFRRGVLMGISTKPFFPTYLFIEFDKVIDHWKPIWNTYGIRKLFSSAPEIPTAIPDDALDSMLLVYNKLRHPELHPDVEVVSDEITEPLPSLIAAYSQKPLLDEPDPHAFAKGDIARVKVGPLIDNSGVCEWAEKDRVKLWLNILGGMVKVSFNAADLELMDSDDASKKT
jgi:transcription antitermination factor NusG